MKSIQEAEAVEVPEKAIKLKKLRLKMQKMIKLPFLFVMLIGFTLFGWFLIDRYEKTAYKAEIKEAIEIVREQLRTGEHKTVLLENKFEADLCAITRPYLDPKLIEELFGNEISSNAKKKIDRIANWEQENWSLMLFKNKKMIFHCFLPYIQVNKPGNSNVLISKIRNDQFGIEFVKVKDERNLEIVRLK